MHRAGLTSAVIFLPFLVVGWLRAGAPQAEAVSAWSQALQAVLRDRTPGDGPGCVAAVIERGRRVAWQAYGLADLEHRVALSPESPIHIASLSKQFTAAAILLLVSQGRLSLDHQVQQFFPQTADGIRDVSIAQMLHHTSGLRDQWSVMSAAGWRYSLDFMNEADVVSAILRQRELNFPAGERHLYSNSGYTMLAQIAGRVSGVAFRDFVTESIFKPLAMRNTRILAGPGEVIRGRAEGYRKGRTGFATAPFVSDAAGAAAVVTTINDLARWEAELQRPGVLPNAVRVGLGSPGTLADGTTVPYGAGATIGRLIGRRAEWHDGAEAGLRSAFVRFPDEHVALVCACNYEDVSPRDMLVAAAREVFSDRDAAGSPKPVDTAAPARLAGIYWDPSTGVTRVFTAKDGQLAIEFSPGQVQALQQTDPHTFSAPGVDYVFGTGDEVEERREGVVPGDQFIRLRDASRPASNDDRFVGEYFSAELETTYRISRDGDLRLERPRRAHLRLDPVAPLAFSSPAGTLLFERGESGGIAAFRLTTGLARRMYFRRLGGSDGRAGSVQSAASPGPQRQQSAAQDPSLNNLVHPPGYQPSTLGELGRVIKSGHGRQDMILIPGLGFSGELFAPFMNANAADYTMYAVTVAGNGGTQAPPMPEAGTSYGEQTWTNAVIEAIVKLIAERKLNKPILVGHFILGTQVALKLAAEHPDKVSSVIIVAGEAVRALPSREEPSKLLFPPLEQRVSAIDKMLAPFWFKTVTQQTWDNNRIAPEYYTNDPIKSREWWKQVGQVPVATAIRYFCEFMAGDVSMQYRKIQVPVLIVLPDFPPEIRARSTGYHRILYASWESAKGANQNFEFATVEDSRILIMLDQPARLSQAIQRFLKKRRSRLTAGQPR